MNNDWHPEIDAARCNQCRQCLNFCLFGVYALDAEDKVEVRNPRQCKPGCPACARVCPEGAILFPKHDGEALGKTDLSALLGGDFYEKLRERNRFSKDRDPARALAERQKYLDMLK